MCFGRWSEEFEWLAYVLATCSLWCTFTEFFFFVFFFFLVYLTDVTRMSEEKLLRVVVCLFVAIGSCCFCTHVLPNARFFFFFVTATNR